MRLSIDLAEDMRMDFVACLTAALVFVQTWSARSHPSRTVTVHHGDTAGLPRLPAERLYLTP